MESVEKNVYVEELLDNVKQLAENNVVILRILERSSDAYYNYKTRIAVIFKVKRLNYTEPDIRDIKVITISAGKHQEYPKNIVEIIADNLGEDYYIQSIEVF